MHTAAAALVAARSGGAAENPVPATNRLLLGIDNFSVRAMGWKAKELIEYSARLGVDSLFITDLPALEPLEDGHLRDVRHWAADRGLALYAGSWSICPTSTSFKKDWGTAEEHLALGIRVAKAVGSPILRVILGRRSDRTTEGGIDARIRDTVTVLKAVRSRALDAGVKVAVENHAGDMHSSELVRLIEEAGPDFVGANLDSGNALWALEDPLENLERLGRYALSSSLRDGVAWESANGVTVQWTALGEGLVDWKAYFARFAQLCPQAPVHIETISGFNYELPLKQDDYWKAWPHGKPAGFERYLALAQRGRPRDAYKPPETGDRKLAEQQYQRDELERSLRYCQSLGLGRRR